MANQPLNFQIEFCADSKGYFDRKCPKCGLIFGVKLVDYRSHDGNMFCPMCGFSESYNNKIWFTDNQVSEINDRIRKQATEWVHDQLNAIFNKYRHNRRSGIISISYKPERRPIFKSYPILQPKEWDLEIKCRKCGKSYSVIGSAFFCPFCGENNIEDIFEKSLIVIRHKLNFEKIFSNDIKNMPVNVATDFSRSILEHCISEVVSCFQKFAETILKTFTQDSIRVNDFQIIKKGNELYERYTGHSYINYISEEELNFLDLMFKRRHLLEHNMGIIDNKYLSETKDPSAKIGQRIVVNKQDISKFIDIIERLGLGLKSI